MTKSANIYIVDTDRILRVNKKGRKLSTQTRSNANAPLCMLMCFFLLYNPFRWDHVVKKLNNVWPFKAGSFGILLIYDAFGLRCQLIFRL